MDGNKHMAKGHGSGSPHAKSSTEKTGGLALAESELGKGSRPISYPSKGKKAKGQKSKKEVTNKTKAPSAEDEILPVTTSGDIPEV